MDDPHPALDARLGREAFAPLARDFEVRVVLIRCVVCHTVSWLRLRFAHHGERRDGKQMGKGRLGITPRGGCSTAELPPHWVEQIGVESMTGDNPRLRPIRKTCRQEILKKFM
jgi:hypothetical protein